MHIQEINLFRYALPLHHPLTAKTPDPGLRRGYLVHVVTDEGTEGWGDCAPLPGFSPETTGQAEHDLHALRTALTGQDVRKAARGVSTKWCPSVRFAVEQALEDLRGYGDLKQRAPHVVLLNALVDPTEPGWLRRAQQQAAEGWLSFKLKVGRGAVEEDVQNARALRGRIGPRAELRLDANRAWDEHEAQRFAHAVEDLNLEYIEEPLKDPTGLRAFSESTGIPVAADESLAADPAPDWREWAFLRAVVIKPTLLGGIASTLVRIAAARGAGVMPVMSSSFESGVGLRHLALLALTADLGSIAHGLDTGRWFMQDLLEEALATTGGSIQRDALLAPSVQVRRDLLEPLT